MAFLDFLGLFSKVDRLSPQDAHDGVLRGGVVIIDVRTPGEWAQTGSPGGSYRICLNDARFVQEARELTARFPDAVVVLSCLSGSRAKAAATRLKKAGFTDLKIVDGGITKWRRNELPIDL